VAGFGLLPSPGGAETTECTVISSAPFTITVQGVYCLKSDLATALATGNAISVNTNNVTIDLNGYKIGNLAAGSGTFASGIRATSRDNVTVRNGTIRGFFEGVRLTGNGHVVEDLRADGNTTYGIRTSGTGNVVRRNHVVNTGGSTYYPSNSAWGMECDGAGSRVLDNQIVGTWAVGAGNTRGLDIGSANGAIVMGNNISNSTADSGLVTGIFFAGRGVLESNRVVGPAGSGDAISINGGSAAVCIGNRSVGYSRVIFQCDDGGGNIAIP
jgi:hypothetical protein